MVVGGALVVVGAPPMAIADNSTAPAVEQPAEAEPAPVTDLDLAVVVEDDAVRLTASADGRSSGTEPLVIVGDAGQVVATCVDSEVCGVEVDPGESASYIARAGDVFSDPVVVPVVSELIEPELQVTVQTSESIDVQEGEVLHTTSDVVDGWGLQIQTVRGEDNAQAPTYASTAWQKFRAAATAPSGFDTSSVMMFVRDVETGNVVCADSSYPFECENGFFYTYAGGQHDVAVQITPFDEHATVLTQLVYDGWYHRYAYVELDWYPGPFLAGDRLEITASSHALDEMKGFVAFYIENVTTGEIIARCTENPCSVDATYYTGEHTFRVFLADPADPALHVAAVTEPVTVPRVSWQTGLYQYGPVQGGRVPVVAPPNQDVGKTNGNYAVYIIDATSGAVLRTCLSGMECVTTVAAVPGRYYTSVIASRQDPLLDIQAIGMPITFTSDGVMRNGLRWETSGGWNPSIPGCQICAGDPVNTFTGEFWDSFVDLSLGELTLERSYASTLGSIDSGWGHGWSSNLDMRLEVSAGALGGSLAQAQQLVVVQENGSFVSFGRVEGGFATAPRVQATLAENPDGTFAFTRKDGATYVFAAGGKLYQITDRNGNVRTLTYGDGGELTQVADDKGRAIDLSWVDGHVTSVTDSAGRSVTYEYDARGDLVETTDVTGASTTYEYDSDHQVVAFTDALGARVENVYEGGRVVEQTDALGGVTTFEYDIDAQGDGSTLVTGPDGARAESVYEHGAVVSHTTAEGTAVEATTTYAYVDGQRVATTDAMGAHSTMTYDERGNVASTTDALGRTTTTTYNDMDQPLVVTDPLGGTTAVTYDDRGNTLSVTDATGAETTYVVNPDGTRAATTDPLGRTTSFTYDERGNPASVTSPDGSVTTYVSNVLGSVTSVTAADGSTTTFTYAAIGWLTSSTDAAGGLTSIEYDLLGNPIRTLAPDGGSVTSEYDAAGRLVTTVDAAGSLTRVDRDAVGRPTGVTDAAGRITRSTYDAAGNQVTSTDPLGRTTSATYDLLGRLTTQITPSGSTTEYTYDAAGQEIEVTNPAGAVLSTTYDGAGRPETVTDADGRTVTSRYDGTGRVVSLVRGDGSVMAWEYDAAGQQTAYTDAAGASTTYAYDAAGRETARTDPAGRLTTSTYDLVGNLISTTAPDGTVVSRAYDALARLVAIDYADDTPDVAYAYDPAGRRTAMTDGTGTTTYAYDDAGRVTSITGASSTIGYSWDEVGQLVALEYPSGSSVSRTYDDAGQLSEITDWTGREYYFSWTQDGQLESVMYPNGVSTDSARDETGAVTAISTASSGGAALLDLAYTYSDASLQSSATVERPGSETLFSEFAWDPQARLASITGSLAGEVDFTTGDQIATLPDGTQLTYDASGQLTTATNGTDQTTFTYDGRGNRTVVTAATRNRDFSWDAADRLTALTDSSVAGTTWTYKYDGDGLRAVSNRTDSDGSAASEQYVWDPSGLVPALLSDGEHSYLYGTSTTPIAQSDAGGVVYLHTDVIGSVRTVTDDTGQVIGSADYTPFGAVVPDNPGIAASSVTRFGFAGEYTDATGLIYLRARYYDPDTAQFLSTDPLRDLTQNLYGYTSGNPLQFIDPLGLVDWGTLGAGVVNFALGTMKVARGGAVVLLGAAASVFGITLPAGAVAATYGVYDIASGVLKGAKGARQIEQSITSDEANVCGWRDDAARFLWGTVPLGGFLDENTDWLDMWGSLP
jgi:RHS repeat-associated protein